MRARRIGVGVAVIVGALSFAPAAVVDALHYSKDLLDRDADRSTCVDLVVSRSPQQRLDACDQFGDPSPFLREMAVAAGGSCREPLHDRCDRSGEEDGGVDKREELREHYTHPPMLA